MTPEDNQKITEREVQQNHRRPIILPEGFPEDGGYLIHLSHGGGLVVCKREGKNTSPVRLEAENLDDLLKQYHGIGRAVVGPIYRYDSRRNQYFEVEPEEPPK